MVRFPEADARRFRGVFVCRRCKTKMRVSNVKVIEGKVSCKKCGGRALRAVKKK